MALHASDLSEQERRRLLDTVRERIGDENYERLIDLQGEDRVIETMMSAALASASSETRDPMVWIWFVVLWGVLSAASGLIAGKLLVAGCAFLAPVFLAVVIVIPSAIGDWFAARFGRGWNWPVTLGLIAAAVASLYASGPFLKAQFSTEVLETFFLAVSIAAAGPALFVHYIAEWMSDAARKLG